MKIETANTTFGQITWTLPEHITKLFDPSVPELQAAEGYCTEWMKHNIEGFAMAIVCSITGKDRHRLMINLDETSRELIQEVMLDSRS